MNGMFSRRRSKATQKNPFVFIPNLYEVIGGRLRLRYCTVRDTYYRDYDEAINPKTSNIKAEWESALYEAEGIQKYKNETHDEVYLDRSSKHNRAFASWKFDFSSSGLVVEAIQVKTEAVQAIPSSMILELTGDDTNVSRDLTEDVNITKVTELEGSSVVTVKIVLHAEKPGCFSKLFLQSTAARKMDCPLDINIRLKRPSLAIGRSLLLLGFMFSKEQLVDLRKRPWRRRPHSEFEKGFLYVHVHQAKRLPLRMSGALPDPQVKCKLMVGERSLACKTYRVKKSTDPVWDEQHVIEGISFETLKSASLEVTVMHEVRTFSKKKRKETLGTSSLGSSNEADIKSDDEETEPWDLSCTRLTELDRSKTTSRSTCSEDIIDILVNASDTGSNSFPEQSNLSLNKHISVSLTSLQSTAKNSISELDDFDNNSWKSQFKWKGFGKALALGKKPGPRNSLSLKRPSIVLSNSQETVVVLNTDAELDDELKNISNDTESQNEDDRRASSWSNLLAVDAVDDGRRKTLTPTVNESTDNWLAPLTQVQQTAKLTSSQWQMLLDNKEEWVYCWHPLTLR